MTPFEYFSAMVAVILALGVTHILTAIGQVAQKRELAKLYWIHSLWVLLILASHFTAWWNIWGLRQDLDFSYFAYLYMLIGPVALFLAASVLVPRFAYAEKVDLRQHYYAVRKTFFLMMLVFVAWPMLMGIFSATVTFSVLAVVPHGVFLVPIAVCAMSSNAALHGIVVIFTWGLFAAVLIGGYT